MNQIYQVGETVIIARTLSPDRIGKVVNITPSGMIDVEVEDYSTVSRFNTCGRLRGKSNGYTSYLYKATPEKIELIKKLKLIDKIRYFFNNSNRGQTFSLSLLEEISKAIDSSSKP